MSDKRDLFTEAHELWYPMVFKAVYAKIGNPDDTDDICQDVFIDFFNKFETIADHRKWLYGALRFAVLKYYRSKKDPGISIDEIFNDVGLTFVNGMRDARIVIQQIIENGDIFRDNADRAVFEMVAVGQMSYSDAARSLGFTKRQVEYRYRIVADTIVENLKKRGIQHLEDLL